MWCTRVTIWKSIWCCFSNAVFHWIKNHETLLDYIYKVLKPKGLLICEFGTSGNIATIENAFIKVCQDLGYEYKPKFNFPTTKHFADLLTKKGFIIDKIYDYDWPTPLKDHERGLENWMRQFFAFELEKMSKDILESIDQSEVYNLINEDKYDEGDSL